MAAEKGAVLIEKWIVCLDEKGYTAVLMDLSKALDTIMHKLLIAKLQTCGFSKDYPEIILSTSQAVMNA